MQPLKYEVPPSVFFYASVWKALVVHFHACLSVQREHNKNQHNVDHNLKSVKATSNSAPIFGWDCTLHRTYYSSLPSTYILGLSNILMYSITICTSGQREVL